VIITTPYGFPAPTTLPCVRSMLGRDERPCTSCGSGPAARSPVGRRVFLRLAGLGALGIAFGARAQAIIGGCSQDRGSAVCCRAATASGIDRHRPPTRNRPDRLPPQGERPGRAPRHLQPGRPRAIRGTSWRATSSGVTWMAWFRRGLEGVQALGLLNSLAPPRGHPLVEQRAIRTSSDSRLPDVLVAYGACSRTGDHRHGGRCASYVRDVATSPLKCLSPPSWTGRTGFWGAPPGDTWPTARHLLVFIKR